MDNGPLHEISQVIQLAVAPVFLHCHTASVV